jgi:hypothetical protein
MNHLILVSLCFIAAFFQSPRARADQPMARSISFPSASGESACAIVLNKQGTIAGPTYQSLIALMEKKPSTKDLVRQFLLLPTDQDPELAIYRLAFRSERCNADSPLPGVISTIDCGIVKKLSEELNQVVYKGPDSKTDIQLPLFPSECFGKVNVQACVEEVKRRKSSSSGSKGPATR